MTAFPEQSHISSIVATILSKKVSFFLNDVKFSLMFFLNSKLGIILKIFKS